MSEAQRIADVIMLLKRKTSLGAIQLRLLLMHYTILTYSGSYWSDYWMHDVEYLNWRKNDGLLHVIFKNMEWLNC